VLASAQHHLHVASMKTPHAVKVQFLSCLYCREHQSYLDESAAYMLSGGPKPGGGPPSRLAKANTSSGDLPAIEALTARPVTPSEASQGKLCFDVCVHIRSKKVHTDGFQQFKFCCGTGGGGGGGRI